MLLCVHVSAFGLALARREHPAIPADEPAVLADKPDRGRIVQTDERAYALGARPGQTVLQARAAAGGVHVLVHDAVRSRAVWSDMLDALDAVSPLVDDGGEGTAYLEMRGIAGAAPDWIARVLDVLRPFDLPVRAAVGPNKFMARASTYAPGGRIGRLGVEVLEIQPRDVERLHLLGVRTLEDLANLPHGPLVRRFGKEAARWHDWARGVDSRPLRPRAHELQIDAAIYGEGTAAQEEQIFFALRVLADRVCGDLQRAGRAASLIALTFECENGDVREIECGFAQPSADPRTLLDVMRAKLESLVFESPVSGLRMQALRLEECGTPAALFGHHRADPQAVAVVLARLQAAAAGGAQRARVREAPQLESRFWFEPFDAAACAGSLPDCISPGKNPDCSSAPQLRLLTVREIAVRMRGNAPAAVGTRAVLDCAGPWRVDDGWFESPVMRDEYDVLLDDGMLCRIYRQGERWYLRGAYD